jgi:hypothetical protein
MKTPGQQQDEVMKLVSNYFDKYGEQYLPIEMTMLHKEHIVYIGASILCTKWEIGYPGGDFAQAMVNNDLREAFGRADNINQYCIKFYLTLMYNVGMPTSLLQ